MIDNKFNPNSRLAKHLTDYIALRKSEGYVFEFQTYILLNLDLYFYDYDLGTDTINNDTMKEWREQRPTEGPIHCNSRNNILMQFISYLQTLGYKIHLSKFRKKIPKKLPYLLSDSETVALFQALDNTHPNIKFKKSTKSRCLQSERMSLEYKVILRLILSCGLRNEEACSLLAADISWSGNYFLIRKSKGDKDRLVYMTESMADLLKQYLHWIQIKYGINSIWVFPGLDPQKPMIKSTLDRKFSEAWNIASQGTIAAKHPTVHSLRHKMVINTIDNWTKNGLDMDNMMPYLSQYLGHSDRSETYYYYHQLVDSLKIVRDHDSHISVIIPEDFEDE